jgi:hypothetical protein
MVFVGIIRKNLAQGRGISPALANAVLILPVDIRRRTSCLAHKLLASRDFCCCDWGNKENIFLFVSFTTGDHYHLNPPKCGNWWVPKNGSRKALNPRLTGSVILIVNYVSKPNLIYSWGLQFLGTIMPWPKWFLYWRLIYVGPNVGTARHKNHVVTPSFWKKWYFPLVD